MLPFQLNILTLNVWGIPFVSSDREARMNAIGTELSTGNYDIVSLQEVWSQADCELLRSITAAALPFTHYFYSGVIGAGLLVLSKYPIIGTLFHAWSVNGYFHRIQHADWFGGKGVGLCRILVNGHVIHLYNAHLHAEYDNENDEYKTHRVIQAFDTAQFIRATRGDSTLQILAGDLNTKPQDISYKVLLYSSKMHDCCTSNAIFTNECVHNSYTAKANLERHTTGIRIDHIFVRSAEGISTTILDYTLPLPERVPGEKFSYSDHEAVLVQLKVFEIDDQQTVSMKNHYSPVTSLTTSPTSCSATIGDAINADVDGGDHSNNLLAYTDCSATRITAITNRINVLHEAIALCDTSLQQLKVDRMVYFSVAIFLAFFLVALVEYSVPPFGFKTLYLLFKFVVFGIIIFCTFMGSIWNFMEYNGILAGKSDMTMTLRCAEQFELNAGDSAAA